MRNCIAFLLIFEKNKYHTIQSRGSGDPTGANAIPASAGICLL